MRALKKVLKIGGFALLALVALLLVAGAYLYSQAREQVYAEYTGDAPSVLQYYDEAAPETRPPVVVPEFSDASFDPAQFREPGREFRPWTRWWWPGNDVEPEELRREIQLFAEHGFGGVEIQPFTCGLDREAPQAEQDRVFSYDTEAYFENLRVVMRAAREAGLGVDISAGGGWPSGGPHIALEDNFKTLAYSETSVAGGQEVTIEIPRPAAPLTYWIMGPVIGYLLPGLSGNMLYFYQDQAELLEVVVARVVEDGRSSLPWRLDDQVVLDRSSVQLLGDQVDDKGFLAWSAPPGDWHIVGIWSMPDGEPPSLIPSRDRGLVVDHFDRKRVISNYNYLFGERAGLAEFQGDPFRAIFNDSYEFKAERHLATGLLEEFERRRGYDLRPWLPAMLIPAYDNMMARFMLPGPQRAAFSFSEDDERVNYDYDLTISELFIERFMDTSSEWMAARGLLNRTQAYGFGFDIIRAMGHAHIPETEQLAGDGSRMFLRMASSGAELYNRPVVTSESLVWMQRDHMTTPQKTKIAVDKLFTSGINQVIFHGTPYRFHSEFFGVEGWQPFASPAMKMMSFASNVSESDPYWRYQKDINRYIARSQYLLRLGRRSTDVLVYYPFLGNTILGQEGELLTRGVLEGPEPPLQALPINIDERSSGQQPRWEARAWKAIRELDRQGISWAWVNDDSLRAATWTDGAIDIRGNAYQAVLLLDVPWLPPRTSLRLAELAEEGARVVVLGPAPARQPGYHDFEENDARVKAHSERILASESVVPVREPDGLSVLAETLSRDVTFAEPYSFLQHIGRALDDGSRLVFLWNTSDEDVRFQLTLRNGLENAYWLDPADGTVHVAQRDSTRSVDGALGPYGSLILYATPGGVTEQWLSPPPVQSRFDQVLALQTLDRWDLKAGDASRSRTALFDWRDDAELRHASDVATYTATFALDDKEPGQRYLVDLGQVYFTADVSVNGESAGSRLFAPYRLDVTDHLAVGENRIEVTVTPAPRNGFIGRAVAGEEPYERLEGQQDRLMAAGLVGPVRLMALEAIH
jgi:hypothetical protein